MFIATIKNVTEKKKLKSLIGFLLPIKSTTTTEGVEKEGKFQKILQNKSKNKKNKCFS